METNTLKNMDMNQKPVDEKGQGTEGIEVKVPQEPRVDIVGGDVKESSPQPKTPQQPKLDLDSLDQSTLLKSRAVQKLIEHARQQEKDKLYPSLQAKDEKIKALEQEIQTLKEQVKKKEESSLEGEKELLAEIQALKEAQEKLLEQLEEERKKAEKAELEAYRAELISKANGEVIEDLVTGNTKEEIKQSFERARQRYQELVKPYKQQIEQLSKPNPKNAPSPYAPQNPQDIQFTAEDIKRMTPEEYAKHREKILKLAQQNKLR